MTAACRLLLETAARDSHWRGREGGGGGEGAAAAPTRTRTRHAGRSARWHGFIFSLFATTKPRRRRRGAIVAGRGSCDAARRQVFLRGPTDITRKTSWAGLLLVSRWRSASPCFWSMSCVAQQSWLLWAASSGLALYSQVLKIRPDRISPPQAKTNLLLKHAQ